MPTGTCMGRKHVLHADWLEVTTGNARALVEASAHVGREGALDITLVSRSVVDALVSYSAEERLSWLIPGDSMLTVDGQTLKLSATSKSGQTAIGQLLIEQNGLSLAARYGEDSSQAKEAFTLANSYRAHRFPTGLIDAKAVVDAANLYEQHASVGDAWEMSLAAWITARIMSRAARVLAEVEPHR